MQSTFTELPLEIEDLIIQRLQISDLKNIRFTCSRLNQLATRRLFHEIVIKPTEESLAGFKGFIENDKLRQLPRNLTLWSWADLDLRIYEVDPDEDDQPNDEWFAAMKMLRCLPRVNHINLRFTADVIGEETTSDNNYDVFEGIEERENMLKYVFRAIKRHNGIEGNDIIRVLTIRNLQNIPLENFTSSELFSDVMGKLHGLHLQTTYEHNESSPEHDSDIEERRTFHPHLAEKWLKPISSNLKRLSLYDLKYWAILPGQFPTENLDFPQLEELSLGHYTIGYDDQLDWLFRCKTIKRLNLHNVMILSHISMFPEWIINWNVSTRDWKEISDPHGNELPGNMSKNFFRYETKWAYFFDRMAKELSNLTELNIWFSVGWSPKFDIQNRDTNKLGLGKERYVAYEEEWIEATKFFNQKERKRDYGIEWEMVVVKPHEEAFEEDKEAFDQLLEVVRERKSKMWI